MVDAVAADGGFDLDRALALYPAPDGLPTGIVNRTELGRSLHVSENTVTKWLAKGMPVEERGTNGQAYAFRVEHCHAWRCWNQAEEDRRKSESAAIAEQWSLHFRGEGDEDDRPFRSAKDIEAEARAQLAQMQADEKRGRLVRADAMRALLEDLLVQFQNSVVTLPDFAEREFGLTPEQVDTLERWSVETITETRMAIARNIVERDGEIVMLAAGDQT